MEKLTDKDFQQEITSSELPVAIDFGATWCGPCKKLDPIMEELAKEYEGRVVVRKVDVGEAPQTAQKYRVLSVPQVLFFKEGQVVDTIVGLTGRSKLVEIFDKQC